MSKRIDKGSWWGRVEEDTGRHPAYSEDTPRTAAEMFEANHEKPSNPKDSVGIRKAPLSTVPAPVIFEIGLAMLEGARKYGRHNYRAVGVRASVYYDALMRHVSAWWEGEDIDPDSGILHLSKAAACLVVLRDSQRRGNCTDDRPPKVKDGWLEDLNKMAASIIDGCPDPKEAFTEEKETKPLDPAEEYAKRFAPYAETYKNFLLRQAAPDFKDMNYYNWDGVALNLPPLVNVPGAPQNTYTTHCPNCSMHPDSCVCANAPTGPCEYEPTKE